MSNCCRLSLWMVALAVVAAWPGRAQNIVEVNGLGLALPEVMVTEADWERLVQEVPDWRRPGADPEARRVAAKLEAHVAAFVEGYPWLPFHHTLGISGYETLFGHPDEMYYALALALPYVSETTGERVRQWGRAEMEAGVWPFAPRGPEVSGGRPREAYEVPAGYRARSPAQAKSLFGLYSFWAWCHATRDRELARRGWPQAQAAAAAWLKGEYRFDPLKKDYVNDEAEQLNGHLAGLLGYARLARWNGDAEAENLARRLGRQWLEWRVNLERANPKILDKSTRSASKSLHNNKLARYCAMTPEIGAAMMRHAAPVAAQRLAQFRGERNGWYLAFGDRFIGGENYTNPAHFPRSVFAGAALIEAVPAAQLLQWVDVPWVQGDYYFMEKCALALWQSGGGRWTSLPAAGASGN